MTFSLALAAAILLVWLLIGQEVFRGNRRVRWLARLPLPATGTWPRVSVIFAARNEAATLGAAVPTMLALDYPDWELIAVNDRSEDATGALLDRLAARVDAARDRRHLVAPPLRPRAQARRAAVRRRIPPHRHRGQRRALPPREDRAHHRRHHPADVSGGGPR